MLHLPGRAWLLLSGAFTLLLGMLIWAEWPASGLWVIGTFVAIDMVFSGTWLIMHAVKPVAFRPRAFTDARPCSRARPLTYSRVVHEKASEKQRGRIDGRERTSTGVVLCTHP